MSKQTTDELLLQVAQIDLGGALILAAVLHALDHVRKTCPAAWLECERVGGTQLNDLFEVK
jgi:hypothetical protein